MQLTHEQERRIKTIVKSGAYHSAEEALDAAVAAVELAAAPDFDGTPSELESLIMEGLNSGNPIEADEMFWNKLNAQTDSIAAAHTNRKTPS